MRVFVIGLDGATWRMLDPLIQSGTMPTLAELVRKGIYGVLHSTAPPVTAVAWSSFQTGVRPAKHGIYGFQQFHRLSQPQGLEVKVTDASSIRVPTLWDHLRRYGKRVGIVNLPMTYPPLPVPGVLVTGFPTPSQRSGFTYPPQLKEELLRAVPEYRVPTWEDGKPVGKQQARAFVEQLVRMASSRAQAARYLMGRYPWDVFVVQFQETDFLQHALWHYCDPTHPDFSPSGHRLVQKFFHELDRRIHELLQELSPEDALLVLSDHGFQGCKRVFYANRWLCERGWLRPRQGGRRLGASLLELARRLDVRQLRTRWLPEPTRRRLHRSWLEGRLALKVSRVYAHAESVGYLSLYVLDKALLPELQEALEQIRDPETGAPVVSRILSPEEAFGPNPSAGAPDLLVELNEGYGTSSEIRKDSEPAFASRHPGEHYQIGIHHPEGILLAQGPGLRQGERLASSSEASLVDIAPTILHLLGLPVPAIMDGRVLEDLWEPHAFRPPLREEGEDAWPPERSTRTQGLTPQEEEEVRRRLKDLGYLG